MNLTVRHIEWLLTSHDCVVIPRLGALLAHTAPARISEDGAMWLAPCRAYTFNSAVKTSDGLLEQSVARARAISHDAAARLVNEDIDAMIAQLHTQGQLSLGRAGTLSYDARHNTVAFHPFDTDALTPLAGWLPALPASPADSADVENAEEVASTRIAAPMPRWKRAAHAAAVVAAAAAAVVVFTTPISVDDASYASTALPAVSGPRTAYVPSQDVPQLNICVNDVHPIAVDTAMRNAWQRLHVHPMAGFQIDDTDAFAIDDTEDNKVVIDAPAQPTKAAVAAKAKAAAESDHFDRGTVKAFHLHASDAYFVVVGSFYTDKAAKQFISNARYNYKGALGILHQGKRYHIYAATGANEQAARAQLNAGLTDIFSAAWITRR